MFWFIYIVVPCLTGACAGLCLALSVLAFQAKHYGRVVLWAVLCVPLVAACLVSTPDNIRLLNLDWLYCFAAVAGFFLTWRLRQTPQQRRTTLLIVALVTGTLCIYFVFTVAVFQMRDEEYQAVTSPDGHYRAFLIYSDGLTYGYYYVAIKPTGLLSRILPAHEVAEADSEGFNHLHWANNQTLVLDYDKGINFVQQDRQWKSLHIEYHAQDIESP